MDEYIVLMRLDLLTKEKQPTPEQLKGYMEQYHAWIDGIVAKGQFVGGKGLSTQGKVLKSKGVITDGPFAEIKESIAGFIIIRAGSLEEAVELAGGCPILNGEGNSVEVRTISVEHKL
ncbi:MAG: transcription initiation protein [Bacteroidetes bacterium]|nr:transcription initiation protein [Bacteroidota bacterium]